MSSDSWGCPVDLRLHHVGFVVQDINASVHAFLSSVAPAWDGRIFLDPLQRVSVAFLNTAAGDPSIELVAPAGSDSTVSRFLERGGGLHHICYEVDYLERAIAQFRARRSLLVRRPLPAVAFDGRRIAWVLTPERLLLEFLERETPALTSESE